MGNVRKYQNKGVRKGAGTVWGVFAGCGVCTLAGRERGYTKAGK